MGTPQSDRSEVVPKSGMGSKQSAASSGLVSAVVFTLFHVVLWICLMIVLLVIVPRFTRMFEEFQVALPAVAQLVVQLSTAVASYWYLFVVLSVPLIALDFIFLFLTGKAGRAVQSIAGVLLALVPLLLGVVVFLGVWLPAKALIQNLS